VVDLTIEALEKNQNPHVIFRALAGSHAYGTAHVQSDRDIRGIFVWPTQAYLTLEDPPAQASDAKSDIVYYNLRRFLQLAGLANPNILEMLFSPADCVLFQHPAMGTLAQQRHLFLTQKVTQTYVGYARAQIKKASGQNKWVNRPQPETPPVREDYCWLLPPQHQQAGPAKAQRLRNSGINLLHCGVTGVQHFPHLYRLYKMPSGVAGGVFKNGKVFCRTLSEMASEAHFLGFFSYNDADYQQAKRDHRHYWEWVANRNPNRWKTQEAGIIDYDAKNMMHTFRLLLSGKNILENGQPIVRFQGELLEFLKHILAGRIPFADLVAQADELVAEIEGLENRKGLPKDVDRALLDAILKRMTREWEEVFEG